MGLFDTVASVGLPASANASIAGQIWAQLKWLRVALHERSRGNAALPNIAFGDGPGADPSPGGADGHSAWARNLKIPAMAECCTHMVAGHEIRNSFPLDSVLDGNAYPANCQEIIYPGVHSDVGGGYRPGESGRSRDLSLIPLRDMYSRALQAGVPLRRLAEMPPTARKDFAPSVAVAQIEKLCGRYLAVVGDGGTTLGAGLLAHMKVYYQWRFYKIDRDLRARRAGRATQDEIRLQVMGTAWNLERAYLEQEKEELESKYIHLVVNSQYGANYGGPTWYHVSNKESEENRKLAAKMWDEYLKVVARLDTMPGKVDRLISNMKIYDEQLVTDAKTLKEFNGSKWFRLFNKGKLRPHYQTLLAAYEAQTAGKGLREGSEIVKLFDNYVHDSLAGFAMDCTLPSDPRIAYAGKDVRLKFA